MEQEAASCKRFVQVSFSQTLQEVRTVLAKKIPNWKAKQPLHVQTTFQTHSHIRDIEVKSPDIQSVATGS